MCLKVRVQNISEIWSPDVYIYNLKSETRRASSSVWLQRNNEGVEIDYVYEVDHLTYFKIGIVE